MTIPRHRVPRAHEDRTGSCGRAGSDTRRCRRIWWRRRGEVFEDGERIQCFELDEVGFLEALRQRDAVGVRSRAFDGSADLDPPVRGLPPEKPKGTAFSRIGEAERRLDRAGGIGRAQPEGGSACESGDSTAVSRRETPSSGGASDAAHGSAGTERPSPPIQTTSSRRRSAPTVVASRTTSGRRFRRRSARSTTRKGSPARAPEVSFATIAIGRSRTSVARSSARERFRLCRDRTWRLPAPKSQNISLLKGLSSRVVNPSPRSRNSRLWSSRAGIRSSSAGPPVFAQTGKSTQPELARIREVLCRAPSGVGARLSSAPERRTSSNTRVSTAHGSAASQRAPRSPLLYRETPTAMRFRAAIRRSSVGDALSFVDCRAANRWRRRTSSARERLSWRGGTCRPAFCRTASTSVKLSVSGKDWKAVANRIAAALRAAGEARSESSQTRCVTLGGSSAAVSTSSAGEPSIRTRKSARERRKVESIRGRARSST